MTIGHNFGNPKHCKYTVDRIGALPIGAESGLSREQAMEILYELELARSKLSLAEARQRLEDAGLIPKR